jgi:ketosteroid isomerase-like protein
MIGRFTVCLISLAVFVSSIVAQSGVENINQTRMQWVNNWNAKQLDGVMALYTENTVLVPPNGDRIVGKDKIRAYFKQILDSATTMTIKVSSEKTDSSGDLGYDGGSYEQTIVRGGGAVISGKAVVSGNAVIGGGGGQTKTTGNYLVVLRRETGKWLIVQQAITEITPNAGH